MAKIKTAVFPVAGLGTRMLPATKVLPKEMLPVVDKPVVQYAVEEAVAAGIERFVFVTGRGKVLLEDHFDRAPELFDTLAAREKHAPLKELEEQLPEPGEVISVRQQEAKGLGHAVWCARHVVGDEPFVVALVDDLLIGGRSCLLELVEAHGRTGGNVVAVMEVPREHTSRYGILEPGRDDGTLVEIKGLVEKPKPEVAPSCLSIVGRYLLMPEIFDHLGAHEVGAGGEIQLTDAMLKLVGRHPFHGLRFSSTRYDCGDKLGYVEAIVAAAMTRPELAEPLRAALRHYL
jgi:UTP--glucose-1-phosphate uridylyltransferase